MLTSLIVTVLNHLLGQADWASRRLRAHAGRVAELHLPVGAARLRVTDDGFFTAATEEHEPDLCLSVPGEAAAAALDGSDAAMKHVRIEGNAEFGEALAFVLRHLEWDAEADLARVVGGAAAPRLHRALLDVLGWQREAVERTSINLRDYLVFEHPTLVARADLEQFALDLSRLRDDLARLEKRICRRETDPKSSGRP